MKQTIYFIKELMSLLVLACFLVWLGMAIKGHLIKKELNQVTVTKIKTVPVNQIDKTIINTFKK